MKRVFALLCICLLVLSFAGCTQSSQDKPTEFDWSSIKLNSYVPSPTSTLGIIEWNDENGFMIHVHDVSLEDYSNYVEECKNKGFTLEAIEDSDYFFADNEMGYHLSIEYEDNILSLWLNSPTEDTSQSSSSIDESKSQSEPLKSTDWKAAFANNGFSDEEIAEYEEILNTVGITDYHDVDIIENGIMHIVRGKIYDSDTLQLNVTLENRKIIFIELAGLPATETEAYINWRGKLKFRTVDTIKSVDLYYDVDGGYVATLDWKNKMITAIE